MCNLPDVRITDLRSKQNRTRCAYVQPVCVQTAGESGRKTLRGASRSAGLGANRATTNATAMLQQCLPHLFPPTTPSHMELDPIQEIRNGPRGKKWTVLQGFQEQGPPVEVTACAPKHTRIHWRAPKTTGLLHYSPGTTPLAKSLASEDRSTS